MGVRLVGVGMGTMSLKLWLDENIFAGDLYVDQDNKLHSALELKNSGIFSAVFNRANAGAYSQATSRGFKGEMTDLSVGLQFGGTFIVNDGEFVYERPQEEFSEMDVDEVLEALKKLKG